MTSDVLLLAQNLIHYSTTTVVDGNKAGLLTLEDCLFELARYAERSGATWSMKRFEGGHEKWPYPVSNLVVIWRKGSAGQHLCYLGHVDTVPAGNAALWDNSPTSAQVKDGFLYGRGATDMKGSVAAFFSAMAEVMQQQDDVHVTAVITGDEEWAAVNGTAKVLEQMKEEGVHVDSFLVGEPSSPDSLGTHIKSGRRGSLVGKLVCEGVQGHAAYAGSFQNPNTALIKAADLLGQYDWGFRDKGQTQTQFQIIAMKSGDFGASAVVPARAEMLWNIRFTSEWSPEELPNTMKALLASRPALYDHVRVEANLHSVSLPYATPHEGKLFDAVKSALYSREWGYPQVDMNGGTTDGRFVQRFYLDAEVLEYGPPERGGLKPDGSAPERYLQEGGMHQVNERISLKDLEGLAQSYAKIVSLYHKR